jgi:hypothetical protein
VQVRRYKARAAVRGRPIDSISGRETWDLRKTLSKPAVKARVEYDIGTVALHPGSIGPIFRSIIGRAFDRGALPDLTADDLARLLKGISAHSTRIGLNQDLFASGRIWPASWTRCGGSRRGCRSLIIAISRQSRGRRGALWRRLASHDGLNRSLDDAVRPHDGGR